MVSTGINWNQLISTDINWYQLVSMGINWYQLVSTGINWYQLVSTGFSTYINRLINWDQQLRLPCLLSLSLSLSIHSSKGVK
jgi:hypothetical protein